MRNSVDSVKVGDKLFLQEILNDLYKNGFVRNGKAEQMLRDWSAELREETHMRGRTKKLFIELVGKELW